MTTYFGLVGIGNSGKYTLTSSSYLVSLFEKIVADRDHWWFIVCCQKNTTYHHQLSLYFRPSRFSLLLSSLFYYFLWKQSRLENFHFHSRIVGFKKMQYNPINWSRAKLVCHLLVCPNKCWHDRIDDKAMKWSNWMCVVLNAKYGTFVFHFITYPHTINMSGAVLVCRKISFRYSNWLTMY